MTNNQLKLLATSRKTTNSISEFKQLKQQQKENNKKQLGKLKLYKEKDFTTFNSWLLKDYNYKSWLLKNEVEKWRLKTTRKNNRKLTTTEWENLEKLYNSLQNYITKNWEKTINLYGKIKYLFINTINEKKYITNQWLTMSLNELVDLEKVYSYFIENIIEKRKTTKRINKKYIDMLFNRIKQAWTLENWENLENEKTQPIEDFINNKYILEKLNEQGKITKLVELYNEKQKIQNDYKIKRLEKLTKEEKEKEYNEYSKKHINTINKIKRLKQQLKIELYND